MKAPTQNTIALLWCTALALTAGVTIVSAQDAKREQPSALANPVGSVSAADRVSRTLVNDPRGKAQSLRARANLRAFEGAPPVVPHTTSGINVQTCRACHAEGVRAGELIGRKVSHTYLTNCTQCHVEAASAAFIQSPQPAESGFVGARPVGASGTRAYPGAPPTIPHPVFMRTNCNSCHGAFGYEGLLTNHTERLNCVQCHATEARFDQLAPVFSVSALEETP